MFGIQICQHTDIGDSHYIAQPKRAANWWLPKVRNLRWGTSIQNNVGGDYQLSFDLPAPFGQKLPFGKGDLVLVYASGGTDAIWAGRIAETPRRRGVDSEGVTVQAMGIWETLNRRLLGAALNMATGPNVNIPIEHVLKSLGTSSLVAQDFSDMPYISYDLRASGFNWPAGSTSLGSIIEAMVGYGDASTPPKALYFRLSGWTQARLGMFTQGEFDVTQEPPDMGKNLVGTTTLAYGVTSSYAQINCGTTTTNAGVIYDATKIDRDYWRDKIVRYRVRSRAPAIKSLYYMFWLTFGASAPACGADAAITAQTVLYVMQQSTGAISIVYRNDAGTRYYWNPTGATWTTSATSCYAGSVGTIYEIRYEHNETGITISLYTGTNTLLVQPTMVPWTTWTTKDTTQLWVAVGEPFTDSGYARIDIFYLRGYRQTSGAIPRLRSVDLSDYEWEVRSNELAEFSIVNPDDELANYVVASYGSAPSYTAAAQDADSQTRYGRRDLLVAAGEQATAAAAARFRDRKLDEAKDERWRGNAITLYGSIRTKGGAAMPLYYARAGDRMRIVNATDMSGLTFLIGSTDYDATVNSLRISPVDLPDSVELWIARSATR